MWGDSANLTNVRSPSKYYPAVSHGPVRQLDRNSTHASWHRTLLPRFYVQLTIDHLARSRLCRCCVQTDHENTCQIDESCSCSHDSLFPLAELLLRSPKLALPRTPKCLNQSVSPSLPSSLTSSRVDTLEPSMSTCPVHRDAGR